MKQVVISIAIFTVTFFSCSRNNSTSGVQTVLDGKWRMIIVKDNVSGLIITKPSSIQGDVDITFASTGLTNGVFSGNTPTNEIAQNDYSLGNNMTISIPNLAMTKVAETSWGTEFVDHIRTSQQYAIELNGNLSIKTISKTLTFKKL